MARLQRNDLMSLSEADGESTQGKLTDLALSPSITKHQLTDQTCNTVRIILFTKAGYFS